MNDLRQGAFSKRRCRKYLAPAYNLNVTIRLGDFNGSGYMRTFETNINWDALNLSMVI